MLFPKMNDINLKIIYSTITLPLSEKCYIKLLNENKSVLKKERVDGDVDYDVSERRR